MQKTIEALDNLISWYVDTIHRYIAFDFWMLTDHPWMYYTVLPVIAYGLFMLFKWVVIWLPFITPALWVFHNYGKKGKQ